MHRRPRVLLAATLAIAALAGCGSTAAPANAPPGAPPAGGEAVSAEYVPGPPVDLSGSIDLGRLTTLVVERHPELAQAGEARPHAERELKRRIGHAYADFLHALTSLQLAVEHTELLNRAAQVIQARVQSGAASTLDRDRVQIELSLLQLTRMRAEAGVHHTGTELNVALLRALDAPFGAPSDVAPATVTLTDAELFERARANTPHATSREAQDAMREAVGDAAAQVQRVVQEIAHLQTDTLPATADLLEQSRARYEAGTMDVAAWIDALRTIFNARSEHAEAVAELRRATVELDWVVGTLLPRSTLPAPSPHAESANTAPPAPPQPPAASAPSEPVAPPAPAVTLPAAPAATPAATPAHPARPAHAPARTPPRAPAHGAPHGSTAPPGH